MEQIRTLNINETIDRLRENGLSIGQKVLSDGIEQGKFPFGVCVRQKKRNFIIFEKKLNEWIAERAM
jgi:hypothetical protein